MFNSITNHINHTEVTRKNKDMVFNANFVPDFMLFMKNSLLFHLYISLLSSEFVHIVIFCTYVLILFKQKLSSLSRLM